MKLCTKYFGEIDYETEELITFPKGLFGFEEEQAFLLMPFQPGDHTLFCLQSVQTPGLAFVVMDPFSLCPSYAPVLQQVELDALEAAESQDLSYYTMCVVRKPVSESTVNLKCPVAINPHTRMAQQVILETDQYHMRHRLAEFRAEEGSSC